MHLAEFVPEFSDSLSDPEEKLGAEIVRKAVLCPARLIANNAGFEGDVIIESLLGKPFEIGYNAVSCLLCSYSRCQLQEHAAEKNAELPSVTRNLPKQVISKIARVGSA